jgi:hypothetical protein
VRVSLSPSACAELADLVQHPVSRSRQGGQSTCATVTERKTGSYPGRWPRSAQRCVATAEATGWAPPGVAVTRVSGLQPTLSSRVRVAVRFTFRAPLAAWCHRVPWPKFLRAGPGSRPWSSAADGCCVAARPARRVRVGLPGLVTSAVTGSMAASRLRASACSLVIEVIHEPGRTPHPAFPQSIFLCSYSVATTERFYAEGASREDGYNSVSAPIVDRRGVAPGHDGGDRDAVGDERGRVVEEALALDA